MNIYSTLSVELTFGNFTQVFTVEATVDGKSLAKSSASKKKVAQTQVFLFSLSFPFCLSPSEQSEKAPCAFSEKSSTSYTGIFDKRVYILMCLH